MSFGPRMWPIGAVGLASLACGGTPAPVYRSAEAWWPGAGVEEIERSVSEPVEAALAGVPGVTRVESMVVEGVVSWRWSVEGDEESVAASDVAAREALSGAQPLLPDGTLIQGPRRRGLVERFVLVDDEAGPGALSQRAEQLRWELMSRPGVADVRVVGAQSEEVAIAVDPQRLAATGLTAEELAEALKSSTVNAPAGQVETEAMALTIRGLWDFRSLEDLGAVTVGLAGGQAVRVSDIAQVSIVARPKETVRLGRDVAVVLEIEGTPPEGSRWEVAGARRHEGAVRRLHPALGTPGDPGPALNPGDLWIAGSPSWDCPTGSCVWSTEGAPCQEVQILGLDLAPVQTARELRDALQKAEGVTGVTDDGSLVEIPEMNIAVDRDRAAALGLTTGDVNEAIRMAVSGASVGTWLGSDQPRDIRLVVGRINSRESLEAVQLRTPAGLVPLGSVARLEETTRSSVRWREDRWRRVSLEVCGRTWRTPEVVAMIPVLPPDVSVVVP